MRTKAIVVGVLALVVLAVAQPSAAGNIPTTGGKISLFPGLETRSYPADTPFFVRHGFVCVLALGDSKSDCLDPQTNFRLSVDGQPIQTAVDLSIDNANGVYAKRNLANFRSGLPAGTHTFAAEWYVHGTLLMSNLVVVTFS